MNTKSVKFRLFVVISIIWIAVVLLVVPDHSYRDWGLRGSAIPIILFILPVFLFWSSVWIWSGKFNNFFDHKSKPRKYNVMPILLRWAILFIAFIFAAFLYAVSKEIFPPSFLTGAIRGISLFLFMSFVWHSTKRIVKNKVTEND